jgi:hypothetical protein
MSDSTGAANFAKAKASIQSQKFSLEKSRSVHFSLPRRILRKLVHFFSYHFILKLSRTTVTRVAGLKLTIRPTELHPVRLTPA